MKNTELIKFLINRMKKDSPKAFLFRLIRMAVILVYKIKMAMWWGKISPMLNGSFVATIQGSRMKLSNEGGISRDLIYNGLREPYATKTFSKLIKPGMMVVDIGANIGYYALQEARIVGPEGKVYAIEPARDSVKQLKANIKLNNYTNIEVFEMAIGDRNGTATLQVNEQSNLTSIGNISHRNCKESYEVPISTYDMFLWDDAKPDIIRMDVEGYEWNIIKGMGETLCGNKPLTIFIELHLDILGNKVKELAMILKTANFKIISASLEPHPAVMKFNLGKSLTAFCDKQIGFPQGYGPLKIQDLIENDIYSSGQIEWLEVIFKR